MHDGYESPLASAERRARTAEERLGALSLAVTNAWAELRRREAANSGHGRDGHLDEQDLDLLREALNGDYR